jgi:hypothetical protein
MSKRGLQLLAIPEECISVKRDLLYCQKRPNINAKETYYYATVEWITAGDRHSSGMPKEA